jgi:hypothetical protein
MTEDRGPKTDYRPGTEDRRPRTASIADIPVGAGAKSSNKTRSWPSVAGPDSLATKDHKDRKSGRGSKHEKLGDFLCVLLCSFVAIGVRFSLRLAGPSPGLAGWKAGVTPDDARITAQDSVRLGRDASPYLRTQGRANRPR